MEEEAEEEEEEEEEDKTKRRNSWRRQRVAGAKASATPTRHPSNMPPDAEAAEWGASLQGAQQNQAQRGPVLAKPKS